jgi:hypothetical protein
MKIQQMAFMLIALTILFVLVGLFIVSTQLSGLKESKEKLDEQNAAVLAGKMASFPEFACENAFGRDLATCVDLDKMMSLKKFSKEYSRYWGVSDIEVFLLGAESFDQCIEENYPNCGIISIFSGEGLGVDKSAFVLGCRRESFESSFYNKCEIAKMVVRFDDVE